MKEKHVCLSTEDLTMANEILSKVLQATNDNITDFNNALTHLTNIPDNIPDNITDQIGGWDAFDIIAKLIISGSISASVFGFYKAGGWVLYYLTSCYEVQAGIEICMSSAILPTIVYHLKEETKKISHSSFNTPDAQQKLAKQLRETYGLIDNFIMEISEDNFG